DLEHEQAQIIREAGRWITIASDGLEGAYTSLSSGMISSAETAKRDIETFARIVVGLGPQATLRRGFAIARDAEDHPIASKGEAMKHDGFRVQFRDGPLAVENREYRGEVER